MEELIKKYRDELDVLRENLADSIDTNTGAENELFITSIRKVSGFIRDLKNQSSLNLLIDRVDEIRVKDEAVSEIFEMFCSGETDFPKIEKRLISIIEKI